ncbi:DNA-directed RNA polymerase subunit delta [Bacillus aquiflavi]|uniref:Probable DNA-directed RNA polymerase subunit delta n=1 Tax=Bacillus aquiflavi TaxID=2672567 RepID=A0A6B3VZG1_9BACI|nr:DNA-directed RNA polymerase subunit delta [Bacillus aquiflavi]MBA4536608.1 DNA-directed RNA polymerase subunit delta [Bacillus aquiflavi]NEY80976.1 DNA-directed RNA polymerase subunit delta [Bacillus aquiflavi]UAC50114.1 DNA-directed RNA polymerase subunit delta [Bacillus aquiflavi]
MALIEVAYHQLKNKKQAVSFQEIMVELKKALGFTEQEVRARISQFYTDLNVDGRFISLGENRWGLRSWYPVEQTDDDTITLIKPKKKKKAKKAIKENDFDEYENFDEDFDDVDVFDDEEDDEELLDDEKEKELFDDDLDEELLEEDEDFDLEEEIEDDDFDEEDEE